jgi:tRNA uridine 5-carboxymethylaminomethyl modification enzyme
MGLVGEVRRQKVAEKSQAIASEIERLASSWLPASESVNEVLAAAQLESLSRGISALQLLRRPGVSYEVIERLAPAPSPLNPEHAQQVAIQAKYSGYIDKQRREVERMRRLEGRPIPDEFDYDAVAGLRNEARENLKRHHPATVGQAARIAGINPADISILLIDLERHRRHHEKKQESSAEQYRGQI